MCGPLLPIMLQLLCLPVELSCILAHSSGLIGPCSKFLDCVHLWSGCPHNIQSNDACCKRHFCASAQCNCSHSIRSTLCTRQGICVRYSGG